MSFLLDENIAAPLADKLDKAGHDVERVVNVSELGEGVDDTTIRRYAVQESRLIVTSDDDFVRMSADSHRGVFYTIRRTRRSTRTGPRSIETIQTTWTSGNSLARLMNG